MNFHNKLDFVVHIRCLLHYLSGGNVRDWVNAQLYPNKENFLKRAGVQAVHYLQIKSMLASFTNIAWVKVGENEQEYSHSQ